MKQSFNFKKYAIGLMIGHTIGLMVILALYMPGSYSAFLQAIDELLPVGIYGATGYAVALIIWIVTDMMQSRRIGPALGGAER